MCRLQELELKAPCFPDGGKKAWNWGWSSFSPPEQRRACWRQKVTQREMEPRNEERPIPRTLGFSVKRAHKCPLRLRQV